MFRTHGNPRGTVRITRRIMSDADERGYRRVVAAEGEVLSIRDAYRRGIPEEALEPVGPAGKVAFAGLKKLADVDEDTDPGDLLDELDAEIAVAERGAQQASDRARSARTREQGPVEEAPYPRWRGGPNWTLSDGSSFRGKREDAEAAEAELAETREAEFFLAAAGADADASGDGQDPDDTPGSDADGDGQDPDPDADGDGQEGDGQT